MKKNNHIETIRGIAIVLLVLFHINEYLNLPKSSIWRLTHAPFDYLRMPLFTVISGFVYALRPVKMDKLRLFLKKKMMRLLLPLFFWSTATYVVFTFAFGTFSIEDYISGLLYPFHQFWFLQVLAFIFVLVPMLEVSGAFKTKKRWWIFFGLSFVAFAFFRFVFPAESVIPLIYKTPFSFSGVFHLLPFFLLGLGIQRFFYMKLSSPFLFLLLGVTLIGVVIRRLDLLGIVDGEYLSKDDITGMIFGLASTTLLMSINIRNKFLVYLGSLAYPIYLIHLIALILITTPLWNLGIYSNKILFPTLFVGCFVVCILITILLDQFKITRILFFGTNRKSYTVKFDWNSIFDFSFNSGAISSEKLKTENTIAEK